MMYKSIGRRYAISLVADIFGQAPRKKLTKAKVQRDINLAYVCGEMSVCELILNNNIRNPYNNIDEMCGDLQILLHKCNEECRTKLNIPVKETKLETIIERSVIKSSELDRETK